MAEGWIKIHRSVLDHWLYKTKKPKTRREAWEDILMLVNYEKSQSLIRGQLYECDRGQSLYSLDTWAEKFNWTKQMVRTFFDLLQREEMIKLEGLQYTTRLTVCNYDKYQSTVTHEQHTNNTPITHEQHTANTPLTPIKEYKEVKERKKREEIERARMSREVDFKRMVAENGEQYPNEMLIKFCNYWTEPNKSGTKMRFELEATWDIVRRLAAWASKDKDIKTRYGSNQPNYSGQSKNVNNQW